MNIIFRITALVAVLLTTSCGKETSNLIEDVFGNETDQIESTTLDIAEVSDNVLINGGTKMDGMPPTPNGAISLDVSNVNKTAFLDEGFEISLDTEAAITGAYIQFKSADGIASDSYYDVNLEINNLRDENESSRGRQVRRKIIKSMRSKTDALSLDIDFNSNVRTGEFCYDICVYDANGNISAPQEICVTVEGWGGNTDLVSVWNLTKEMESYDNSESTCIVGEPDCIPESSFDCNQGGTYQASYICYTTESLSLEFRQDGTYTFNAKESGSQINDESSSESCEAIYDEFRDDLISNGRWAYIAEGKRLVMIEYSYSENYRGEIVSATYEAGEAEVLLDGTITLDGSSLVITQDFFDESEMYYFEK